MIPFFKHSLIKNKNYIKKTLASSYLTSGPVCEKAERLLKIKFKKKYAILTNSWTNGLITILLSLKLKPDDEIIIPACTFVACANVIEMVGAKVVFADIDPSTKLMDINDCIKKITKNIITIENPIEKSIKNITQIQTEDQINLSFDKILKAILSQDPDVIMIGEIRDEKTAKAAIQAAETGHLVLASLHTNGTAETINRLIHMGIPNYYIADCLSLIISCRLLKINNTRIGVYEVMQITNKIKQLIYQKATTQEIYDIASNINSIK